MNAATGRIELDAKHVSIWAGMSFVAQIVFQLLSPITGDRFGLRVNMWIFTVAKIIVSSTRNNEFWRDLITRPSY